MKYLLIAAVFLAGCATVKPNVPDSIPATGSSVEKAQAHIESASGLVVRATPESNKTGQALLAAATEEQGKAVDELKVTKAELAQVAYERKQLEALEATVESERDAINADLKKVKDGWGYRLQQLVLKLFWLVVSITALHFILGIAGIFVTGPFGNILAKAGVLLNPFAWFQSIRDNHYFNKVKKPDCPPAA